MCQKIKMFSMYCEGSKKLAQKHKIIEYCHCELILLALT